jgi:aspartate/methionine/tyrosine aminotransferase
VAYPFFVTKLLARSGLARWLPSLRRYADGAAYWHFYSDRVLAAPYRELGEAAILAEAHGPDAIDLATGEPRFDLVPSASTKLPADRRGLPPPWGLPELREAVAERLACDESAEVLITQGATGAFHLAADAFVNPGDKVVLFDPTSPLYAFALRQRRARVRWVPTWMEDGRTRFHLEPLVKALKGARLLVVNSPANPTGGILAPEDLEQIAWWAARYDVLLFNDEAFADYRYEGAAATLAAFPKARGRTLTAGSVSKGFALAAARVGWLSGHRHLIRPCLLTAVLQNAFVPTLCQQIALSALRLGPDALRPTREEFAARRAYVFGRLQALGLKPAWPAGAFFFWVPVQELGLNGKEFAKRLFAEKTVLVWPGDHFGPSGSDFIRLSYATDDGRLHQGLARLADFVRECNAARVAQARRAA